MDAFGVYYGVCGCSRHDRTYEMKCVFDIPLLCKSKMAAMNLYKILENVHVLVEPNADGPHGSIEWVILIRYVGFSYFSVVSITLTLVIENTTIIIIMRL